MPDLNLYDGGPPAREALSASPLVHPHMAAGQSPATMSDLTRVLNGEALAVPPVWFMRQAGRFLPEYRAIRAKASFEDLLRDPDLAAEVTLQPLRRFPKLDGAIIFSDILIILDAFGCGVTIPEGGPRLAKTLDQIPLDQPLDESRFDAIQLAIRKVRKQLPSTVAMLGFAGAPWTLFAYGLEGRGSKTWSRAKTFLHQEPRLARAWLNKLADAAARLLNLQIQAGAQAVQLFDTWASELDGEDWRAFSRDPAVKTLEQIHGAPRIYFPRRGTWEHYEDLPCEGISVPWQLPMEAARHHVEGRGKALQGNLDPCALLAGEAVAIAKARAILQTMQGAPHIFNLGHGILPETDPAVLAAVIEAIKGQ